MPQPGHVTSISIRNTSLNYHSETALLNRPDSPKSGSGDRTCGYFRGREERISMPEKLWSIEQENCEGEMAASKYRGRPHEDKLTDR